MLNDGRWEHLFHLSTFRTLGNISLHLARPNFPVCAETPPLHPPAGPAAIPFPLPPGPSIFALIHDLLATSAPLLPLSTYSPPFHRFTTLLAFFFVYASHHCPSTCRGSPGASTSRFPHYGRLSLSRHGGSWQVDSFQRGERHPHPHRRRASILPPFSRSRCTSRVSTFFPPSRCRGQ